MFWTMNICVTAYWSQWATLTFACKKNQRIFRLFSSSFHFGKGHQCRSERCFSLHSSVLFHIKENLLNACSCASSSSLRWHFMSPMKCSEDTGFVRFQQESVAIIHDISAHHRLLQDDSETFDVQRTWSQVEAESYCRSQSCSSLTPTEPQRWTHHTVSSVWSRWIISAFCVGKNQKGL